MRGVCALTGREGEFVDCHLIPKRLYPYRDHRTRLYGADPDKPPRRARSGEYDSRLVTEAGEEILQQYDNYGIRFLRQEVGTWRFDCHTHGGCGWWVRDFDYSLVRLFFLSMLWRCGVTTRLGQIRARIDGIEPHLRAIVRDGNAGDPTLFPVMLGHFAVDWRAIPVAPFHYGADGRTAWHSALIGGYKVQIDLGAEHFWGDTSGVLQPDRPWRVPSELWFGSLEQRSITSVFRRDDQRWNITRRRVAVANHAIQDRQSKFRLRPQAPHDRP